jgi:hypothetical protein
MFPGWRSSAPPKCITMFTGDSKALLKSKSAWTECLKYSSSTPPSLSFYSTNWIKSYVSGRPPPGRHAPNTSPHRGLLPTQPSPLVVGRGTTAQGTSSLFICAWSIGPSLTLSGIACMSLPACSLSSTELFGNPSLPQPSHSIPPGISSTPQDCDPKERPPAHVVLWYVNGILNTSFTPRGITSPLSSGLIHHSGTHYGPV